MRTLSKVDILFGSEFFKKYFRQYDYIIKAETSTEDAPIILNQIDYNETELEHRNTADGSLADDPAAVGTVYKDIARVDHVIIWVSLGFPLQLLSYKS